MVIFLGRTITGPKVKSTTATSRTKVAHVIHVTHRDEIEPPLTDWLQEAYDVSPALGSRARAGGTKTNKPNGPGKTRKQGSGNREKARRVRGGAARGRK